MKIKQIAILGGTGFVGRELSASLVQHGYRVRILTRHPHRHKELASREIALAEADVHDAAQLRTGLQGVDAVVNLVGIRNERASNGSGFQHVHVELPRTLVAACTSLGIGRVLHMSALKAGDPSAKSHYLRTKGEGEAVIHAARESGLSVTTFRPSVIFGPGDSFINQFAFLLRMFPVLPLPCSEALLAPIYVRDVVTVLLSALSDSTSDDKCYDLCGPTIYTLQELVEYIARVLNVQRIVYPLSPALSQWQARVLGKIPGKPLSLDNYWSLQIASTCPEDYVLPFGIQAMPLEAVVPFYLGNQNQRARYQQFRAQVRY